MISSMTGYGSASRQVSLGAGVVADLQVECRAVNSRFLDLGFRLPDECRGAEPALREMATQSLARGKVEFRAAWRVNSGAAGVAKSNPNALGALNKDRLDALYTLQEKALEAFPKASELAIADILRWPGIVSEPRGEEEGWIAATVERYPIVRRHRATEVCRQVLYKIFQPFLFLIPCFLSIDTLRH